jgi:hypothetical protein
MPPFPATAEQRRMVERMIGLRVSHQEICEIIHNPRTGRPIARSSFLQIFAREIAEGRARLKDLVGRRYYEALRAGEVWAVRAGLRNLHGWVFEGQQTAPLLEEEERLASPRTVSVQFCVPDPASKPQSLPVVDVTPEAKPDYSRPALPKPTGRLVRTPFGTWLDPTAGVEVKGPG